MDSLPGSAGHVAAGPPLSTEETFGVLLVGFMVSAPLYGVVAYQAWQYYSNCWRSDGLDLRAGVTVVFFLETATQVFNSHAVYYYLIEHKADVMSLQTIIWSLVSPAGTTGLEGTIIQMFFGYKVYIMSGRKHVLLGLIAVLSITSLVLAWIDVIEGLRFPNILTSPSKSQTIKFVPASFGLIAGADLTITALLSYFLWTSRQTQLKQTKSVLNRLILLTVNNGVLVSATASAALITKLTCKSPTVTFVMSFLLSKAYTNMYLSSLNSRQTSRNILNAQASYDSYPGPDMHEEPRIGVTESAFTHVPPTSGIFGRDQT